jgi:hypothetical protein
LEIVMAEKAVKLLQGYIWHPKSEQVDLGTYLPKTLESTIHVLWDEMHAAPFAFFENGTLSSTQQFYQLTVVKLTEEGEDPGGIIAWVAETLQAKLETTPKSVGWQILEDLRDI